MNHCLFTHIVYTYHDMWHSLLALLRTEHSAQHVVRCAIAATAGAIAGEEEEGVEEGGSWRKRTRSKKE